MLDPGPGVRDPGLIQMRNPVLGARDPGLIQMRVVAGACIGARDSEPGPEERLAGWKYVRQPGGLPSPT
eukprot:33155-Prorocentrum_minimum.AAC.1